MSLALVSLASLSACATKSVARQDPVEAGLLQRENQVLQASSRQYRDYQQSLAMANPEPDFSQVPDVITPLSSSGAVHRSRSHSTN